MALKQLGSTYAVGADSAATAVDDTDTLYRGSKDILVWHDEDTTGGTNLVVINFTDADQDPHADDPHKVNIYIYDCVNLLADPGDPVTDTGPWEVSLERFQQEVSVSVPNSAINKGLYRIRILVESNEIYYTLSVKSPWYSLECWEPKYSFYVWGKTNTPGVYTPPPITQFFFVPTLADGETVRVRLQADKLVDEGHLRIYKADGTTKVLTFRPASREKRRTQTDTLLWQPGRSRTFPRKDQERFTVSF